MRKHPWLTAISGVLLTALAFLSTAQWVARQQALTRGWTSDPAAPLADARFSPASGAGVADLCVNTALEGSDGAARATAWSLIARGGFTRVRQRFVWAQIETEPGVYNWSVYDALIAESAAHGLKLVAVLDGAPEWAGNPPDPAAFAAYAGALAARYADHLTYYQVWHNPNLADNWAGRADPYGYTELLAAAAGAIRSADPDARIVLGSLAPTVESGDRNFAEDLFLDMLYTAGAGPYFDVIAVQPYGFDAGPEDRTVARDTLNFSRAILAREALTAHGDENKAVWASHFGWNSLPADVSSPASIWGSVDEVAQARYTVEALERARREWPWMGLMCLNGYQPRAAQFTGATPDAEEHWGFALVDSSGQPRPVYDAVQAWADAPQRQVAPPGSYRADTSYAQFKGTWTLGPQGADIGQTGDSVSLTFEGTGVALTVRRGPYRAFLFVTVDGQASDALPRDRDGRSYVVLYDPLAAVATVTLAEGLPYGIHTVEVIAERGWAQWALADWRVFNEPDLRGYRLGLVAITLVGAAGLALLVCGAAKIDWGRAGQTARRWLAQLGDAGQWALSLVLGALTLFAGWQTLLDETVFRRLGERGSCLALLACAGLFYFSPWFLLTLGAGVLTALLVAARPALGLALAVAAAPLYLHPLSLLGKSFSLVELVLLPALAGWALRLATRRRDKSPSHAGTGLPPTVLRAVLAFLTIALLSTVAAQHQREAWRELRLVVLEPALLFFALVTMPLSRRDRWRILDAFVVSAVAVAVIGLVQYFLLGDVITAEEGVRRLRSIYGSPNNVGLYLGRALPLLIAVVLWSGRQAASVRDAARDLFRTPRRWLYLAALAPVSAALLLSLSRGAIVLGIPAALLTLGLLGGRRWRIATLVVVILGVLALIPLLRTPRFAGMLDLQSGTTGFRMALWHSTLGMIRDHPLLGVGLDNFLYAYRTRYVLPTAWEEFNLSHPHNVVLDFAARLGLPGLAVFIWMQAQFWREAWRHRKHTTPEVRALALGLMASMADFLAHGLVDASYFIIDLAFVYFLTWAAVLWLRRWDTADESPA